MSATVSSVSRQKKQGASIGLQSASLHRYEYYTVILSAADNLGADIAVGPLAVAAGLPDRGTALADGRKVLNLRADMLGQSGAQYTVTVEYGIDQSFNTGINQAPWLRDPVISMGVVEYPWVLEYDITGAKVVNKAGDQFSPPIMTTRHNRLLRVRYAKRISDFDPDDAGDLVGTINGAAVTIRGKTYDTLTCLLKNVSANEQLYSDGGTGTPYWDITLEIEVENEVPLDSIAVQNKGYNEISPLTGKRARCTVADGVSGILTPSPVPCFLNDVGEQVDDIADSDPLVFVIHHDESWAPLQLT